MLSFTAAAGAHAVALIPTEECPRSFSDPSVTLLVPISLGGTYIHTCNTSGTVCLRCRASRAQQLQHAQQRFLQCHSMQAGPSSLCGQLRTHLTFAPTPTTAMQLHFACPVNEHCSQGEALCMTLQRHVLTQSPAMLCCAAHLQPQHCSRTVWVCAVQGRGSL